MLRVQACWYETSSITASDFLQAPFLGVASLTAHSASLLLKTRLPLCTATIGVLVMIAAI